MTGCGSSPHGTTAQARAVLATADLGLVSLMPDVITFAYPSKTASYLAEGLPVLVAVEPDSSLARASSRETRVGGHLPVDDRRETARGWPAGWAAGRSSPTCRGRAATVWQEEFATERLLPRWAACWRRSPTPATSTRRPDEH